MKVKKLVYYSMGIALTLLLTWLFSIPALVNSGYINLGDVGVLLSGLLFGPVGGMIAGAVGSSLADIFLGFAYYAPFTFIVKGLEGLIVGTLNNKTLKNNHFVSCLIGAFIMVFGYFLVESFLYGFGGALPNIAGNSVQGLVGAVLASLIYGSMKRTGVVKYIKEGLE